MDDQDTKQDKDDVGNAPLTEREEKGQTATRRIRRTPWGRPRSADRRNDRHKD